MSLTDESVIVLGLVVIITVLALDHAKSKIRALEKRVDALEQAAAEHKRP